jgi:hypothetical protein
MKKLAWIAAASAALALIVALGFGLLGGQKVSAQGNVDFDIDPDNTGNTASAIGNGVQDCYRVDGSGGFDGSADVTIDVVVQGDTLAPAAYDAWVIYEVAKVDPLTWNDLIKLPAAIGLTSKSPPQLNGGALYLAGGPGTAGNGTILRIDLDVDFTTPTIATFTFAKGAYTSTPDVVHPTTTGTGQLAINTPCVGDEDGDGVPDASDLCPGTTPPDPVDANGCSDDQVDGDGDGVCDPGAPSDGPSGCTGSDNCPSVPNASQTNSDGDTLGDACDNCPDDDNEDQTNSDTDSHGDACDNCPDDNNETQTNSDGDTLGDACDNCPDDDNEDQTNSDTDSHGDACDNCPDDDNEDQADTPDGDGIGNVCDPDDDGDNVDDVTDNCPLVSNPSQANSDADSHGDACDNCPEDDNEDQADSNGNGIGDVCEAAPAPKPTPTPTPTPKATPTAEATPEVTPEATETPEATPTEPAETCPPTFPGTYHGSVRLDGVPAASGTVISALVDGIEWASGTVADGLYVLDIPETLPATPPCFEGGTITFTVAGYVCSPSPDWASGLHNEDVSCEVEAVPTPTEPTPVVTPVPGVTPTPVAPPPSGGGGLLNGGSAPWTAGLAAAGVLALLLTAVGLSRGARSRSE